MINSQSPAGVEGCPEGVYHLSHQKSFKPHLRSGDIDLIKGLHKGERCKTLRHHIDIRRKRAEATALFAA